MKFTFLHPAAALAITLSLAAPALAAETRSAAASAPGMASLPHKPTPKAVVFRSTHTTKAAHRVVGETNPNGTDAVTYIVQLDAAPLASYRGGLAGFTATSPSITRESLERSRPAVRAYTDYLVRRQDDALAAVRSRIGHSVTTRFRYQAAFNGFAVSLTPKEAAQVATLDGVRLVQREFVDQPQTDRGPAFIGAAEIWDNLGKRGEGIVIGSIDTGINFDSPSFTATASDGYTHTNPRGHYFGVCDPASAVYDASFSCNNKLIGAWDFADVASGGFESDGPADSEDHGSHTASTVAGNPVTAVVQAPTTLITLAISGVAPRANIIAYDVCFAGGGCPVSALVAAIDQATIDGVDVINYSIGSNSRDPWISADSLAMLGAIDAGVFVAVSAGNSGPTASTIGSPSNSPWVASVAASTHDRKFTSALTNLNNGTPQPDIAGASLSAGYGPAKIVDAANYTSTTTANDNLCLAPFAPGTFNGEIVVCERGENDRVNKGSNVLTGGAGGMILVNNAANGGSLSADAHYLPAIHISYADGVTLRTWISDSTTVTGTIAATTRIIDPTAGDHIASFSSRGPDDTTISVLKPDLAAPGVDIIAAAHSGSDYMLMSGTSMASPHTAGAAALLKSTHPNWTPSELRSALMLSAIGDIQLEGTDPATPFETGAGRINVAHAAASGLVMDEQSDRFYEADPIFDGDPSALNLASLTQSSCIQICTWTRVFRNTSNASATWDITVNSPASMTLSAAPATFTITPSGVQTVTFTADVSAAQLDAWVFGSVHLSSRSAAHPLSMPVSVLAKNGDAAFSSSDTVNIKTRRNAGAYTLHGLRAATTSQLTAAIYAGDAETDSGTLPQDPTNSDSFDIGAGGVFTRLVNISDPSTRMLSVQVLETTARDLDLYIGLDSNGDGQPSADEIVCMSATSSSIELCSIDWPLGTYWIALQNYAETNPIADTFSLSTVQLKRGLADPNLGIYAPTTATNGTPFDLDITWNLPDFAVGSTHVALLEVGTTPTSTADIASRPVIITRASDHVSLATDSETTADGYVLPGQSITFTITIEPEGTAPENTAYAITATLPNGLDYVSDSSRLSSRSASTSLTPVVNGNQLSWSIASLPTAWHYALSTNNPSRADYSAECANLGGFTYLSDYGITALPAVQGNGKTWNVDALLGVDGSYSLFGRNRPTLYFTDDGLLANGWRDPALNSSAPAPIPSAATPNALLAPFWADMEVVHDPAAKQGVYVATDNFNSLVLVEYDGLQVRNDPSTRLNVEAWVMRNSLPGLPDIIYQYDGITGTLPAAVVGVENPDGLSGTAYTGTITNGLNLCWTWKPEQVQLTYTSRVRNDVISDTTLTTTVRSSLSAAHTLPDENAHALFVSGIVLETSIIAPDRVHNGAPVAYTLLLTNTGVSTAHNLVMSATVPLGADYVSGGNHAGGVVTFSVPSLAAGAHTVLSFTVSPAFDELARSTHTEQPNIIGGNVVQYPGKWPWQVALIDNLQGTLYNGQFCGGSLISRDFVLTAAHCVTSKKADDIDVLLGQNSIFGGLAPTGQQIRVAEIIVYPNYQLAAPYDSDLALLRLAQPAVLTDTVQPIRVAIPGFSTLFAAGITATVTGWGNISASSTDYPFDLYEVEVPIYNQSTCVANYASIKGTITENMLCAGLPQGGKDSCQGDSGGPLVVRNGNTWLQAGVVSWGSGCAQPNLPGVYTRLANFASWVNDMRHSLGPVSLTLNDGSGLAGHASTTSTRAHTIMRTLLSFWPMMRAK